MKRFLAVSLLVILGLTLSADKLRAAPQNEELIQYLKLFHKDPEKAMQMRLPKRDLFGHPRGKTETLFSKEEIAKGASVDARDEFRKKMFALVNGYRFYLKVFGPGKSPSACN